MVSVPSRKLGVEVLVGIDQLAEWDLRGEPERTQTGEDRPCGHASCAPASVECDRPSWRAGLALFSVAEVGAQAVKRVIGQPHVDDLVARRRPRQVMFGHHLRPVLCRHLHPYTKKTINKYQIEYLLFIRI